jgi:hypothetical protein
MLTFHDRIPDVVRQVCAALLAQEYRDRGQFVDATVLFLRLDEPVWHRFFVDAGVVFWKTVAMPDRPPDYGDYSYRLVDIAGPHGLIGRRLSAIETIDLPGGGVLRLRFEGGTSVVLHNTIDSTSDSTRLIVEHEHQGR